jgi:hypothetical protein
MSGFIRGMWHFASSKSNLWRYEWSVQHITTRRLALEYPVEQSAAIPLLPVHSLTVMIKSLSNTAQETGAVLDTFLSRLLLRFLSRSSNISTTRHLLQHLRCLHAGQTLLTCWKDHSLPPNSVSRSVESPGRTYICDIAIPRGVCTLGCFVSCP